MNIDRSSRRAAAPAARSAHLTDRRGGLDQIHQCPCLRRVRRRQPGGRSGVVVYTVTPDGPTAKAGIRPGAVLTAVAGRKIATVEDLFASLREHQPGETVSISYMRGGEPRAAQVKVTDRPS